MRILLLDGVEPGGSQTDRDLSLVDLDAG